ncbi:hypothetical protein HJC23_008637 [Cyclotella cryptica]|uniref:Uncharacterized protein n=1 Tax=Cyclotella cryptica TaxID=29204 RepID=A0ABD3NT70_9STRA|eukprot:CCRYP_020055-RA/>CCRYP_020055-RA protein AED:0.15 eAED:0.15 QI:107/1/1/1/1/1/2/793/198
MMKSILLALLFTANPASSFTPTKQQHHTPTTPPRTTTITTTTLQAHNPTPRRTLLGQLTPLLLLTLPITTTIHPQAQAIETYLTEPTEEFKESERQRIEFRKNQLLRKGEFIKVLTRLTTESTTEEALIDDLTTLRNLVVQTGGLPLGIKKEDMYKVIRSRKAKGNWPTDVEIAYQKLKAEVAYQQSPNTEKDMENPL